MKKTEQLASEDPGLIHWLTTHSRLHTEELRHRGAGGGISRTRFHLPGGTGAVSFPLALAEYHNGADPVVSVDGEDETPEWFSPYGLDDVEEVGWEADLNVPSKTLTIKSRRGAEINISHRACGREPNGDRVWEVSYRLSDHKEVTSTTWRGLFTKEELLLAFVRVGMGAGGGPVYLPRLAYREGRFLSLPVRSTGAPGDPNLCIQLPADVCFMVWNLIR